MAGPGMDEKRLIQLASGMFRGIEHFVYIALGILLSLAALLGLSGAVGVLWQGLHDYTGTESVFLIIDRLLFVLLLVEILHTIRASLRSGGLTCEPFLIVGLIASIRRVLVITLQTSEETKAGTVSSDTLAILHESMIELAVLGGLILILVVSLVLLIRAGGSSAAEQADEE